MADVTATLLYYSEWHCAETICLQAIARHRDEQSTEMRVSPEAIIFLHLPKSAGTTLNRLIEWEYPIFQIYSVDPVFFEWSSAHLWKLPAWRLKKFRVFKGHMVFGLHEILPQPATYITVLREPIDRMISAFYFMRGYKLHPDYWRFRRENWTLEDFAQRWPRDNIQTKIIAGAAYKEPCTPEILSRAMENLDRHFSVVGLSERFEESLALMKLRFGWKLASYSSFNVTRSRPKKRDLPQTTLDLIAESNAFDIALYEKAKTRFEGSLSENQAGVARIVQELQSARINQPIGARIYSFQAATKKAISRAYSAL